MVETLSNYTLRHSPKAKYLQLKVSPRGIEVVIPAKKHVPQSEITRFVAEKQKWLEKIQLKYSFREAQTTIQLPEHINLAAINQQWQIKYCKTSKQKIKIVANADHHITVIGNIEDTEQCLTVLRQWLKQIALRHLAIELARLSQFTGLPYNRCTIRINTTRWGSCSANKHISLCCKLLFLPPELVSHIIIHELCHTKFMNHGASFWRLLRKLDSEAILHSKQLRSAGSNVPLWV